MEDLKEFLKVVCNAFLVTGALAVTWPLVAFIYFMTLWHGDGFPENYRGD